MLDFAEFVAINKFDRKRRRRRAARRGQAGAAQPRRVRHSGPSEMPVFGTMASRFNDDGVTALYQALKAAPGGSSACALDDGAAAARCDTRHSTAPDADRARRARALPGRDRRRRARLQGARAGAGRARARGAAAARERAHAARGQAGAARRRPLLRAGRRSARRGSTPTSRKLLAHVARDAAGLRRRRVRGEDPRQGDPHAR